MSLPTVQVRQGSPAGAKAVAATRVLTVAPGADFTKLYATA